MAGRYRKRTLALAPLFRSVQGYCPNCLMGKMYDGFIRPRLGCDVCSLVFHKDSSVWLGAAFFIYLLTCAIVAAEGVALWLLFGPFPGYSAVLVASVPLIAALVFRPVRGIWIWFLWYMGFLS